MSVNLNLALVMIMVMAVFLFFFSTSCYFLNIDNTLRKKRVSCYLTRN